MSWLPALAAAEPALHDPMRPASRSAAPVVSPAPTPVSAPRLRLESTVIGSAGSRAVINGHLYAVGERHRGITLLAVEPGRARVRQGGDERWLSLRAVTVRRDSP